MSFKDQLVNDLAIFFNTSEFANEVVYQDNIGSKTIIAVVMPRNDLKYDSNDVKEECMFLVKHSDIAQPKNGDKIVYDSAVYRVDQILRGNGYSWELLARRNESVRTNV